MILFKEHFLIKTSFFLLVIAVISLTLYSISVLFGTLLIAFFITMLLKPAVIFFESKGHKRIWVISTIYFLFFSMLGLFFTYTIPLLTSELKEFSTNLPTYIPYIKAQGELISNTIESRFPSIHLPDIIPTIQEKLQSKASSIASNMTSMAGQIINILTLSVLVPFISFFFLKDGYLIQKSLLAMIPNRYFEMFALLFHKVMNAIALYIRGQLIDAAAVGIMTGLGLSLIGFPYAIVIGLVAGVGNIIPYLGPIIGFIPAAFIMFVTPEWFNVDALIWVLAIFALVQIIESTVVYPIAVGNTVEMHPLLIILGITIGGQIAGIMGMIIVIPLIAIIKVTIEVYFKYLRAYDIIKF